MNIRENMGNIDRFLRVIIAVVFVVAYFNGFTGGILGLISLTLAVAFLANSVFGVCLFYRLLGIDTRMHPGMK